ncbi:MAG: copper amine oxidase N-terminal domain-containing protein [Fimbriimonadaceae bacterium]|nr:copper amine oxidase N-terminal domain-containing protein [Fimbriimonadaceae bacterium]
MRSFAILAVAAALGGPLAAAPSACSLGGVTLVPAQPVLQWLGADLTVDQPGVRLEARLPGGGTVLLGAGSKHAAVNGRRVPLSRPALGAYTDLLVPLRFFADLGGATAGWDPASRKASLTKDGRAWDIVVPEPVYPLAQVDSHYLIGGLVGTEWIGAAKLGPRLGDGITYQTVWHDEHGPTVSGTRPRPEAPGDYQHIDFTPELEAPHFGLAVPWNQLPRTVSVQATTQPYYLDAVRGILRQHGLSQAKPNIRGLLRVDLEGDGVDEVLLAGTIDDESYPRPNIKVGDYSFIAVRQVVGKSVRTILLDGEFYQRPAEFAAPCAYEFDVCADVDGDAVLEIVTSWRYYEGGGTVVYKIVGGQAKVLVEAGVGA